MNLNIIKDSQNRLEEEILKIHIKIGSITGQPISPSINSDEGTKLYNQIPRRKSPLPTKYGRNTQQGNNIQDKT